MHSPCRLFGHAIAAPEAIADRRHHAPDVALLDQIRQLALVGFLNGQGAARYQCHWQQRRAPWSIAKESSARERSTDSGRIKLPFQQTGAPVPIGFRISGVLQEACRSVRAGTSSIAIQLGSMSTALVNVNTRSISQSFQRRVNRSRGATEVASEAVSRPKRYRFFPT